VVGAGLDHICYVMSVFIVEYCSLSNKITLVPSILSYLVSNLHFHDMLVKQTALRICICGTFWPFSPQAYGQDFQGTEERKRNYSQEGMHATILDLGI
jgi:hypothetical protein